MLLNLLIQATKLLTTPAKKRRGVKKHRKVNKKASVNSGVLVVRRISGINCGRELREAALWGWKKVCFGCTSQEFNVQSTKHLIREILSLRQPNLNHSIDRSTSMISASGDLCSVCRSTKLVLAGDKTAAYARAAETAR